MYQKESLFESVQNIVTSAKLKRNKIIEKLKIPMKKQKKSESQLQMAREKSTKHVRNRKTCEK